MIFCMWLLMHAAHRGLWVLPLSKPTAASEKLHRNKMTSKQKSEKKNK